MEPNPKIIDNSPHQFKNDEIDIISLLKRIIHFRRLLLKITLISENDQKNKSKDIIIEPISVPKISAVAEVTEIIPIKIT